MKISLLIQVATVLGVLAIAKGYQPRTNNNGLWSMEYTTGHYGFNHPKDPLQLPKATQKLRWQNAKTKIQWLNPKSKSQWRDRFSKPQWNTNPTAKPQWHYSKSKPQWQVSTPNQPTQRPEICLNNPPRFVAMMCIPCLCNPNYNSRQWPDYIPPLSHFKPSLDDLYSASF